MEPRQHWQRVYGTKQPTEVSWYRAHLETSLRLIADAAPWHDARIIDVGAGASTLVDDLLARGYENLEALDVSAVALEMARARLGGAAERVTWLCDDVRTFPFRHHAYDVWHDRAVFHFLTAPADRAAYVTQVARAVKPAGHVIVATFGPEGPTECSGLDVVRYDPEALHEEFGSEFRLMEHLTELHQTPRGATQQFVYCYCKVTANTP